jgi:hypothetical protein
MTLLKLFIVLMAYFTLAGIGEVLFAIIGG